MKGKPGLAIILAGLKKKSGAAPSSPAPPDDADAGAPGPDGDLEMAAQDILSAIEARDPKALAGALQSFCTMAEGNEPAGE